MDPRCRVEMLGPLRLVRGDQALTRFGTQKAAALLAYLALRPGPHAREQVIDAFWPDMDLPAGRNNLNTALSALRHALEPAGVRKGAVLVTSHAHVGLDPSAVTTDVADFERLLSQAGRADEAEERAGLLGRALSLWGGDFQAGNYQDWAVREGERLSARRVEALDRQGDDLESLGLFADAAEASRRRLEADAYEEGAYVGLIRRLVRAGQTGAAHEASAQFERFFKEEFGGPPTAEASRAARAALALSPAVCDLTVSSTAASPMNASPVPTPPPPDQTKPISPLPFWLSRFFGREAEMARISELLLSPKGAPDGPGLPVPVCRLVTLTGMGGTGKTRLAAEFARQALERVGMRCAFVALADVASPAAVADALARALGLPPSPAIPPLDQALDYLRNSDRVGEAPFLLILDNCEHLLGDEAQGAVVTIVRTLLAGAPAVSLLCTSRRALAIQGERLVPLGPLRIPEAMDAMPAPDALAALSGVASVRLYIDRAQAVRPVFGLTTVNASAVASLCWALEGSPLALELAASWVRLLPPRKIWERLSQGLGIPESRQRDLPSRHRSLSAALDWSWRLLTEEQRRMLASLSVFRGGWTLDAAEAVSGETNAFELLAVLDEVATGMDTGEVCYGLLEAVCEDTFGRLEASGGAREIRTRHAAYFLEMAEESEKRLTGPEQQEWLGRLEEERDNLRTALDWHLIDPDGTEAGTRLAGSLWRLWYVRGDVFEGRRWLSQVLARDAGPSTARALTLRGAGTLAFRQGDFATAKALHEQSLIMRRGLGDESGIAESLNSLGVLARNQGDARSARDFYEQALVIRRRLGDRRGIASALNNLAIVALDQNDHAAARERHTEALAIFRELGDH